MALTVKRRRFTVEEYRQMWETGILADDPRIELIAGSIVVREPTGSRHAGTVDRVAHLFISRVAGWASSGSRTRSPCPTRCQSYSRIWRCSGYARAGIAAAWVLDLTTDHVEVCREPSSGRYREIVRLARGASLAPLAVPDFGLVVDDLLG